MPLPFVIAAWVLGSAVAGGGGAAVVGAVRADEAKEIDEEARKTFGDAKRRHTRSLRAQERAAQALGERKIQTVDTELRALQKALSLFRHLDLSVAVGKDGRLEHKVDAAAFDDVNFDEWHRLAGMTAASGALLGKAMASGAATSAATMALGIGGAAATTGTAIGSLGGAAAANATLAWFGGGALSAGGAGMAGGTMVLGGIAVAPVALAGGIAILHSGTKALDHAKANRATAETAASQAKAACAVLDAVAERAARTEHLLERVAAALDALVPLVRAAARREPDARHLTDSERTSVVTAFRYGELVTELVALQLIWRGSLTAKSERVLDRIEREIEDGG